MLENLVYSINTVIPIFVIVIFGWILRQKKFLSESFFAESERLVFKFALPVMLFLEIVEADSSNLFDGKLVLFCVVGIVLTFLVPCVVVPLFLKDNQKRGAFIQGVYRSNFAILGVPLAQNMFGDAGSEQIAIILPFAITLFNVFAVIILSIYAPEEKKLPLRQILKNILLNIVKNPLIIAVVLAIPFLVLRVHFPMVVTKSLTYVSNLTFPLALMSLGANFKFSSLKGRAGLAIIASILKTVVLPVVVVGIAIVCGFRSVQLGVIFILFGGPTAVSSYIMAKNMESDYELAGQILLLTTLLCVVTLFLGVFFLKTFQFV